jgi:sugar phosphate isomerase/epimerase
MTTTADSAESAPRGPRIYAHCWTLLSVMGPLEAARFAAENGFAGLELFCNPRDFWPGLIPGATLDELAAIGRDEGIEYSLYGCYTNNATTRLPELKALDSEIMKRVFDVAAHVGAKVLCIHPGEVVELRDLERKGVRFQTERFDRARLIEDAWKSAVEAIGGWADLAAPMGVTIVVENDVHVRHTVAGTAQSLAALVEATKRPNVKVNFDTGHAFLGGGLMEEFDVLEHLIGHFHLDDNATPDVSDHLPLGEGAVPFPSIARRLGSSDAALAIEIYAPERAVEATLASRDYILNVIREAG